MTDVNHWHVDAADGTILATYKHREQADEKARSENTTRAGAATVRGCDCLEYFYEEHNDPKNPPE